jgi:hypothetical protein
MSVSLSEPNTVQTVTYVNTCPSARKKKCDAVVCNVVFSGGDISGATLTRVHRTTATGNVFYTELANQGSEGKRFCNDREKQ